MYFNYQYKDSLLKANLAAFEESGREYNNKYYQSLWDQSKVVTCKLITDSSKSAAELIRTAWIEAGRPSIPREIGF